MTDKQVLFCKEYIIDLNASAAAVRAGYSNESARSIAYELLAKEEIETEIRRLINERSERLNVTADDVLREFYAIGMSNVKDFLYDDFEVKNLDEIDLVKAKAIKSVKKTITEFEGGSKTVVEFQLHDKISGLNSIGKHIGFFEKDNQQKNQETPIEVTIVAPKDVD